MRARNESDHENDSMSFHVDGERSCENLEETSLWPHFHVTHTGTGFTYHVEHISMISTIRVPQPS